MTGKRQNIAAHKNKDLSKDSVSMLCFGSWYYCAGERDQLIYQQYLDYLHDRLYLAPDLTEFEMFLFLGVIKMGHDLMTT
jgi:hypothetical protein